MGDDSINTDITLTLNQIISNEQSKDAVLKEKRAVDEAIVTLSKCLKELKSQAEHAARERLVLEEQSDQLLAQLEVEKVKSQAMCDQLEQESKRFEKLRQNIATGISEVWATRSDFTKSTQELSEQCDIWALMMKPIPSETVKPAETKAEDQQPVLENYDERLKLARERKQSALAERDRLRTEPESAEEFIRIKNALRYFSEISAQTPKRK